MDIDKLLNSEYWIIDILPKRVPEDSPGQYFAVENHFLSEEISVYAAAEFTNLK